MLTAKKQTKNIEEITKRQKRPDDGSSPENLSYTQKYIMNTKTKPTSTKQSHAKNFRF